jgi:ABC-type sugar transport system substrate-binding protein
MFEAMLNLDVRRLAFLAAGLLLLAGQATADSAKCTVATQGDSPVAQACQRGGRAEAKKVMKGAVKAAKDKGGKFTCDNCHKNLDTFELKPNAREDFKKLLELAGSGQPAPAK